MITAVKDTVITTGLDKYGITLDDVGLYSLGVGGNMALKLNGISDTVDKKTGRWTSMAFM